MRRRRQLTALFLANCAFGQFAPPASQGQPPRANQIPLSGRSGQSGSVAATDSPVPGTTTSVNTINPTVQVQGSYAGSATSKVSFSGKLSLREAVERGLQSNLGAVGIAQIVRQAHGQSRVARSALLPNVNANLSETVEQLNLAASGLRFRSPVPGFSIPTIAGPFNLFDLRASLSQTVVDFTLLNNYRATRENLSASELLVRDAKDLVVLAVGGTYLQAIASMARVNSARAQLETANALYQQTSQQRSVGLVAQIDVNRSRVQLLIQQQRLVSLQNDLAKQKINLARMTGLPPSDHYELGDEMPFQAGPAMSFEDSLKQAFEQRSDLKAAEAQVRAAERARSAARAERYPSASVNADYGVNGTNPARSHGTFSIVGSVKIPIWQSGRIDGDIEQAQAALAQRQAELEDIRGQVETDVRKAYLDLESARSQVDVARENLQVNLENLELTQQRYEAGITDTVEVVRAHESIASAELDHINSVFGHNLAKLNLARAVGRAADNLSQFLEVRQP